MTKCSRNLKLRIHRSPCLKANQKSSDKIHNRLAASRQKKKNKVEIPQGRPDMTAAALFTDGITYTVQIQ
jgi:hypothetical protein